VPLSVVMVVLNPVAATVLHVPLCEYHVTIAVFQSRLA